MLRFIAYIFILGVAVGCGERLDGEGFLSALAWLGNHKALAITAVALLTPLIAIIPGFGVPLSVMFAKIGVTLIPALVQIADAMEADEDREQTDADPKGRKHMPDRSIKFAAGVLVSRAVKEKGNPVGMKPGAELFARFIARRVMKKARKKRLR